MKELGPASVAAHGGSEATWGSPTPGASLGQGTGEVQRPTPRPGAQQQEGLGRLRRAPGKPSPATLRGLLRRGSRLTPSPAAEGRKRIQFEPKFHKPLEPWDLSSMPSRNQKREISLSRAGGGKSQIHTLCWGGGSSFCPWDTQFGHQCKATCCSSPWRRGFL